jgi:hypothetical protein
MIKNGPEGKHEEASELNKFDPEMRKKVSGVGKTG